MDARGVRSLAFLLAPAVAGLLFWLVFYREGLPLPWVVKRPVFVFGALALVFGPILIGNYLAGRRGKPPLS